MDSRPSSLNILKKFFIRVTRLDEYIRGQVSENRYARLLSVAQEHEGMKNLIQTAYVCLNPKLQIMDDDDGLDDLSVLSIGEHATQTEASPPDHHLFTLGCSSRVNDTTYASRK